MKSSLTILRGLALAAALAALASCATPKNIAYFQDANNGSTMTVDQIQPIRIKPADQISIIVNALDPNVSAMFNLPYYSNRIGETQSLTATTGSSFSSATNISGYTVDPDGYIDFPVIGKVQLAGKTRQEATEYIKELLIASRQIKDPVVTIEFMNLGFSVLGEVTRPGRFKIDRDYFTVLDAISLAGDLTINGQREDITVLRQDGDNQHIYKLNLLRARQLYTSPAYYVQQGDVIYVTPNDRRRRDSTVNGNNVRSSSFWLSLASLGTSIALLVLRLL